MDFFAQQDRARRNTRYLLLLFCVTVILLIALVNALVTAFVWFGGDYNLYAGGSGWQGYLARFSLERFLGIGLLVALSVALVSLVRWLQLASGGKTVAESMGGRRILVQSTDHYERRCLNVVEELALAANMPVPAVYLMENERGINAFAAGITPADAVVAVTRGTMVQLNRDELQGVIGHEFSHILNGDMRLGIRLAALLKGITFIGDVGHFLLRFGSYRTVHRSRSKDGGAALPIVGLGLMVIGWLGSLAAAFIKSAISRQKEYLADASAVQFTRNNEGIANALKAIGGFIPGSLIHAARAEEMSHIFFGEVTHRIWNGFATHPPLEQRIRRLDPNWNGEFTSRSEVRTLERAGVDRGTGVGQEALVAAAAVSVLLDDADFNNSVHETDHDVANASAPSYLDEPPTELPVDQSLYDAAHEPFGASALALALLAAREQQHAESILSIIRNEGASGQAELVSDLLNAARKLAPGQRFELMATAMPALRSMSTPQYRQFKNTLLSVIRADRQTDLFEWCLYQLLRHYLDPEYFKTELSRPRHKHLAKVRGPLRQLISVLAHQGDGDSEQAFNAACADLGVAELKILPLTECDIGRFSQAVHTLADCYPLLKPRILKAMAIAAADDGVISTSERELVIAVAAVMDCPVPQDFEFSE